MKKRILAILLCLGMIFSLMPMAAIADEIVVDSRVTTSWIQNDDGEWEFHVFTSVDGDEASDVLLNVVKEETVPADCENDGLITWTVNDEENTEYNGEVKEEVIPALGHTEDEAVEENVVDACVEDGSHDEVVYCAVCGEELSRTTVTDPADGTHEPAEEAEIENVVAATCTEAGSHDEVIRCTTCKKELSRITVEDAALGHDWEPVEGAVTKAATCTEEGYGLCECSRCGEQQEMVIPALGHTPDEDSVIAVDYEVDENGKYVLDEEGNPIPTPKATCVDDGYHYVVTTCDICDEVVSVEKVVDEATGHDWEMTYPGKAATCTEEGYAWFTCNLCNKTEKQVIPALGHDAYPEDYFFEVDENGKYVLDEEGNPIPTPEATCVEDGYHYVVTTCDICGEVVSVEKVVDEATGKHTYTEAVVENEVAATCSTEGSYDLVVYCSVCGEELEQGRETIVVDIDPEAHVWESTYVIKEATCTEDGEGYFECALCGEKTDVTVIPALGHTPDENSVIAVYYEVDKNGEFVLNDNGEKIATPAATCVEKGYHWEITFCSVCGEVCGVEKIVDEAFGHTWDVKYVAIEPTCTEDGVGYRVCETCGEKEFTIPATGHTEAEAVLEVNGEVVDYNCTEDMECDSVVYCSVCGDEISRDTVTLEAQEAHSYDYVVNYDKDDPLSGVVVFSCTNCVDGHKCADVHNVMFSAENAVEIVDVEATCTTDGSFHHQFTVSFNGEDVVFDKDDATVIPAPGHVAAEAVVENEVAVTCTTDGSYDLVVYCSVCGEELSRETIVVPTDGHAAAEAVIENEVAATCTTDGSYDLVIYCTVCGEELSRETIVVPAFGHKNVIQKVENVVAATCTTDGSHDVVAYCTVCGEELSRITIKDEALGHVAAEAVVENEVAATCTTDGSYDLVVYCSVCGEELSRETIVVPALGHNYVDGVCTVCSAEDPDYKPFVNPFKDVAEDAWYYNAVMAAAKAGIMNGVSADTFDPNGAVSRAMVVQVLYNMANAQKVETTKSFSDVAEDAWYYNAVMWAAENGIVSGVGDGKFAPNANITRQDLVCMLYRYAKVTGADVSASASLAAFSDAGSVSNYAADAMQWAVANGYIKGNDGKLMPVDGATRAQLAVIMVAFAGI